MERITGDKGQGGIRGALQHVQIVGLDDLNVVHPVLINAVQGRERDPVIFGEIFQATEEAVPVARNPQVARLAWHYGSLNAADGAVQGEFVCPLEYQDRKVNRG